MANEELDIMSLVNKLMADPNVVKTVKQLSRESAGAEPTAEVTDKGEGTDAPESVSPNYGDVMKLLPQITRSMKKGDSAEGENRNRLLSALKPYLNSNRRDVIDKIISLPDITRIAEMLPKNKTGKGGV